MGMGRKPIMRDGCTLKGICRVPSIKDKMVKWFDYRRTYHMHLGNKLVCRKLEEKCLGPEVKSMLRDIEAARGVGRSGHLLRYT
jgi:hypothetical protein